MSLAYGGWMYDHVDSSYDPACGELRMTAHGGRRVRQTAAQPQVASFIVTFVALIIGVVRTSVGPYSPGVPANVARTSAVWSSSRSIVNFSAGRPSRRPTVRSWSRGRARAPRLTTSLRRPARPGTPRCGRSRRGCCRRSRGLEIVGDVETQAHLDRVGWSIGGARVRRDGRLGVQVVVDLRRGASRKYTPMTVAPSFVCGSTPCRRVSSKRPGSSGRRSASSCRCWQRR